MAVDERARRHMHERLDAVLGVEAASALREELTVAGREQTELRTELRTGLADVRTELADVRSELADVRTELHSGLADVRTEVADVRTELADVRTELRTGLADVRTELRTGLADVRTELRTGLAELRGSMAEQFETYGRYLLEQAQRTDAQTRLLVFSMWGAVMTVAAIAFAAARLA